MKFSAYLFLLVLPSMVTAQNDRPNFVLIMTDDQGWGSLTSRSDVIHTPGLDTLIAHGINFNRFYSASSVCSPTRASLVTGRNPYRLGIPGANSGHLDQEEKTVAELAKDAGYATGHYGKWHLGVMTKIREDSNRGGQAQHYSPPWYHGYDHTFATESKVPVYNPMVQTAEGAFSEGNSGFYGTYYWVEPEGVPDEEEGDTVAFDELQGDDAMLIMDKTIQFIDSAHTEQVPFLTTIWIHTPHAPMTLPRDTAFKYYPDLPSDEDKIYYSSIEMMSNQVLRVYKHLESLGILNNTFIFFNSDNGGAHTQGKAPQEAVGGLRGGKTNLWEGGIRVPGILVWPSKIPEKRETEFPAFTSDIYPTIKAILGVDVPDQKPVDGINLLPVIDALVAEQPDLKRLKPMGFIDGNEQAWIDGDMKIYQSGTGNWQLYNLTEDRNETTNLASTQSEVNDSLQQAFDDWRALVDSDGAFDFENETNAIPVSTRDNKVPVPSDFTGARADVYDVSGKVAGSYLNKHSRIHWDGVIKNRKKKSGLYIISLITGKTLHTKKVLIK